MQLSVAVEPLTPGLRLALSRLSVLTRTGVPPQKSLSLLIPPSFPLALRVTWPSLSQLQTVAKPTAGSRGPGIQLAKVWPPTLMLCGGKRRIGLPESEGWGKG